MIDILYYYYYLFYKKIMPDVEPPFTAVWVLSVFISFLLIVPASFFMGYFHIEIKTWYLVALVGAVLLSMYLYYIKSGRWKKIIQQKPKFRNSNKLSIIITIAFSLFCFSVFIAGVVTGRKLNGY